MSLFNVFFEGNVEETDSITKDRIAHLIRIQHLNSEEKYHIEKLVIEKIFKIKLMN